MCSLDPALVAAPLVVQIRYMRDQLDFLKSLDESPMYDLGVLQMDGDIGDTGILPTDGSHTGIRSQMDGGFGASNADPTRDTTLRQPAAAAPAAAGRALHTEAVASSATREPPPAAASFAVPPMPASFARGRHAKNKPDRVDPQEYWAFTFQTLRLRGKAIGSEEMARAFTQHKVTQGHPAPDGHKTWWSRDRVLMLQMFEMAGVPIVDRNLRISLQSFWKDSSRQVLAWLTEWLKSGLLHPCVRKRCLLKL